MNLNDPVRLIGVAFIFGGLLNIFTRDIRWKVEKAKDAFFGKRAERTQLWDFWQIMGGLIIVCLGLGMLLH